MTADLVDRIYEAAFVPELWVTVFESLTENSKSASGSIMLFGNSGPPSFVTTSLTRASMQAFFGGNEWKGIVRPDLLRKLAWNGFVCDVDYLSPDQIELDPTARQLKMLGLSWQLASSTPMPTGETAIFTFERHFGDGRHPSDVVAMLDGLKPHLARASMLAVKLGLERAKVLVDAMEAVGLPAAVVKQRRIVMATNPAFDKLGHIFQQGAFGAISLLLGTSNKLFHAALEMMEHQHTPRVLSIPVAATEHQVAAVVHVFPVRGEAFYVLGGARQFIAVTQAGSRSGVPDQVLLRGLFDLTPTEARLAEALVGDSTIPKYVADTGASLNTVKTHLKRIFEKTGVSRQADLIKLLSGLTLSTPTTPTGFSANRYKPS